MQHLDDADHPLLRRTRAAAQQPLVGRSPRRRYGGTAVREVVSRSALTEFSMKERCWSLNPYAGCQHGCVYCYVPTTMHVERQRWSDYVVVKRNLVRLLASELKRRPRRTVYLCTSTDPYQPAEAEHRLTRDCLRLLARHDWPVRLLTRSPLVIRDIDLFRLLNDVEVGLSVPTLDDNLRQILEPTAPPIHARLQALTELANAGITTYANYAPACPFTDTTPAAYARAMHDAGVQWVHAAPWGYLRDITGPLAARLHGTQWRPLVQQISDRRHQEQTIKALAHALHRHHIPLGRGFFSRPAADHAATKRHTGTAAQHAHRVTPRF